MGSLQEINFQLVLEFSGDAPDYFRKILVLEEELEDQLESGIVDGNDVGAGVVNLFIVTKHPKVCFGEACVFVEKLGLRPSAAGFREIGQDRFIRLLPKDAAEPFRLR